jgi:hypothetical protein
MPARASFIHFISGFELPMVSLPPAVTVGTADGATATSASAADTGMAVDTDATPSVAADDAHATGALIAGAGMAVDMATGVTADGSAVPTGAQLTARRHGDPK